MFKHINTEYPYAKTRIHVTSKPSAPREVEFRVFIDAIGYKDVYYFNPVTKENIEVIKTAVISRIRRIDGLELKLLQLGL